MKKSVHQGFFLNLLFFSYSDVAVALAAESTALAFRKQLVVAEIADTDVARESEKLTKRDVLW